MAGINDGPEGVEIAGWENQWGEWENTEQGDDPPTEFDLSDTYQVVISFRDDDGNVQYRSIMGGAEDWADFWDMVDDLLEEYG